MTTPGSPNRLHAPGVYVTDFPAFPQSVVGVATAVPIFVGYTEFAGDPSTGRPLYNQAVSVASMTEYAACFGGGLQAVYGVALAGPNAPAPPAAGFDFQAQAWNAAVGSVETRNFVFHGQAPGEPAAPRFNLWAAMTLFFLNGGGPCFVVSVADYWGGQSVAARPFPPPAGLTVRPPTWAGLEPGLTVAGETTGPSMLVVPDACLLPPAADGTWPGDGYAALVQAMLGQAGALRDRVAIIDLPGVMDPATWTSPDNAALAGLASALSRAVAPAQACASYGAAYAPAVEATLFWPGDIDCAHLRTAGSSPSNILLNNILTLQARAADRGPGVPAAVRALQDAIGLAFPADLSALPAGQLSAAPAPAAFPPAALTAAQIQALTTQLRSGLPLWGAMETALLARLNVAPPSGIMAGLWAANDQVLGVWHAPANVSVASVSRPTVLVTDAQQPAYNLPPDGRAVCLLRAFPGAGVRVWGARTLDGNDQDYRYIPVRRLMIYVEQSIKQALPGYLFEANAAPTWASVAAMIAGFLTDLWKAGALAGPTPADAFQVGCGLGSTMTQQDILDGRIIVDVALAPQHPAEFIVLSFSQIMQTA